MLRRVLLAAGVMVLSVGLAGCIRIYGTFPASALPSSTATVTAPVKVEPVTHGFVGEELSTRGWNVTVARAEFTAEKVGGVKPAPDSRFMVIDVGFVNKGNGALEVRADDFELLSESGESLPRAEIGKPAFNARSMRPLLPNFGTSTVFVYRVPLGRARYTFVFTPPVSGKKTMLEWQVP